MFNVSRVTGLLYLVFALSVTQIARDRVEWWFCVAAGITFAACCGVAGYYQDKGVF